jgi:hypothetical protein
MTIDVVQGETGTGKGAFAVALIQRAQSQGKRVATNMDLFLEYLQPKDSENPIIRLPDIPAVEHFNAIGFGSPPENKNKRDYGLIVLDECSLFLDTAHNPELKPLMKWLVQRRKKHWDIVLIVQHKDQLQDKVFNALCNRLVVCKADDLVPIPYFGKFLRYFGSSGMLPEGHTAFIYNGKSEAGSVIEQIPYKNKPVRNMYDTDQVFEFDNIYHNDISIDMRAIYTYLPASVLTKTKYIKYHQQRLEKLQGKVEKGTAMAKAQIDPTSKFKIIILSVAALAFVWWQNPFDNPLIAGEKPIAETQPQQQNQVQQLTPQIAQTFINPHAEDLVLQLFRDYRPRLAAHAFSEHAPPQAIIDFYQGDTLVQRLTIAEFQRYGYAVIPAGIEAVIVRGKDFNKTVISFPLESLQKPTITDKIM